MYEKYPQSRGKGLTESEMFYSEILFIIISQNFCLLLQDESTNFPIT